MQDMVQIFKDFVHAKFAACRDLANRYYEKTMEAAMGLVEKATRHDEMDEIPQEVFAVSIKKFEILKSLQKLGCGTVGVFFTVLQHVCFGKNWDEGHVFYNMFVWQKLGWG